MNKVQELKNQIDKVTDVDLKEKLKKDIEKKLQSKTVNK